MTDKAAEIKKTVDLFQDMFSHLDIEYPILVEDIESHEIFNEDQIAILIAEGFASID